MIRRIALTLATTLALVLVACGDKAEPNADAAKAMVDVKNVAAPTSQPAMNTPPPPPAPETPPAPPAPPAPAAPPAAPAAPAPAAGGW